MLTLIADADGTLVFFNEAAEAIVGKQFGEIGDMLMEEFSSSFMLADSERFAADRGPLALRESRSRSGAPRTSSCG